MNTKRCLLTIVAMFCLAVSHAAVAPAALVRTVALSGDPAPGTTGGVKFSDFNNNPVLNSAGQAAFIGDLTGAGVSSSNDLGVWSEGGGGGLALVARKGSQAPGTAGGVNFSDFNFSLLNPLLFNSAGQTAFQGRLTGPGVDTSNDFGIWSEGGGGGLALVAREGSQAPGTAIDVNFANVNNNRPVLNDAGQTAFVSGLTGTGVSAINDTGLWSEGGGGGLTLIAREGDQASGVPIGLNFGRFGSIPSLNGAGQVAFKGGIAGVSAEKSHGIWSGGAGGLALVARGGNPAPGTPSGVFFLNFSNNPVLNDAGQTAFFGTLSGLGGASIPNDSGIWSAGGGGGLALVVREGDPAPGTAGGVNFSSFFFEVVLNSAGQTAFLGTLTGPGVSGSNDTGIWSEGGGGGLTLVAREGDQAPGVPIGLNFAGFNAPATLPPLLNGAGQTAFMGTLIGPGVGASNDLGIWAEDTSGQLTLIVREGDLLDIDDGPGIDLRTISTLSFLGNSTFPAAHSGNEDGRPSGFNEKGQVTFFASFSGGTGVFVSNLIAVPDGSGDFDFDFDVDGFDFLEWQRGFGSIYDAGNLANWEANYGAVVPLSATVAAVPEPATCMTLLLGMMALHFRRDRAES